MSSSMTTSLQLAKDCLKSQRVETHMYYYFLYSGYYEAGEMFSSISSMSSSMTTSLQLAKDCLESERVETNYEAVKCSVVYPV